MYKKKIAIPILFNENHWMGGVNYFKSLLSAFALLEQNELEIYVITNVPNVFDELNSLSVKVIVNESLANKNLLTRLVNKIIGYNYQLSRIIKKNEIALISHYQYSKIYKFPTIWWKPDFQEKYYPDFFTKKDLSLRDRAVKENSDKGILLFSSFDAANDYRRFYPEFSEKKIHVLQFVPYLDDRSFILNKNASVDILKKYNVKKPYFFLPNQFWVHKNHEVVLQALKYANFNIVSTGAMNDYRGDSHITHIKDMISKLPEGRFKCLGLIPREDLSVLMQESIAVINPSRFEGWSTTVEEAKYLGKRLILSDLAVHREQSPKDAIYFDCNERNELILAMERIIQEFDANNEYQRQVHGKEMYLKNRAVFAREYYNILIDALETRVY